MKLLLLATVVVLSVPSLSFAHKSDEEHKHGKNGPKVPTKIRASASLTAPLAVVTSATGRIKRKADLKRGVIKKDSLSARVHIPLPSLVPAIPDAASALLADVRLVFSREGVAYAECTMKQAVDTETEDTNGDTVLETISTAVYKLNVELLPNKHKTLRARKGTCDVDLVTADVQLGVPAVQAGDTVSVQHHVLGVPTEFLLGSF